MKRKTLIMALALSCVATIAFGLTACDGGSGDLPSELKTTVEESLAGTYRLEYYDSGTYNYKAHTYWDVDPEKEYYYAHNEYESSVGSAQDVPSSFLIDKHGYYKEDGKMYLYTYTEARPYWQKLLELPEGDDGMPQFLGYKLSDVVSYVLSAVKDHASAFEFDELDEMYDAEGVEVNGYTSAHVSIDCNGEYASTGTLKRIIVRNFKGTNAQAQMDFRFELFGEVEIAPPAYYKPDFNTFKAMTQNFIARKGLTIRQVLGSTELYSQDTFNVKYMLDEDFYGEVVANYANDKADLFLMKNGTEYSGYKFDANGLGEATASAALLAEKTEAALFYPQKIITAVQNSLTYDLFKHFEPSQNSEYEYVGFWGDVISIETPQYGYISDISIYINEGAIDHINCKLSMSIDGKGDYLSLTITAEKPAPVIPTVEQTWVLTGVGSGTNEDEYKKQIGATLTFGKDGSLTGTIDFGFGSLDTLTGDNAVVYELRGSNKDSKYIDFRKKDGSSVSDISTTQFQYYGASNSESFAEEERSISFTMNMFNGRLRLTFTAAVLAENE